MNLTGFSLEGVKPSRATEPQLKRKPSVAIQKAKPTQKKEEVDPDELRMKLEMDKVAEWLSKDLQA